MSILLIGSIIFVFWIVVPGFITGWMLREGGRSFARWFAFGAVCGPFGVLAALVFVFVANRSSNFGGAGARGAPGRRRPRMSYAVPLLGPLHASTVWMLAGFATFVCIWVLGGVGYELYLRRAQGIEEGVRFAAPNAPSTERAPSAETTARVAALSASETHSNTDVAGKVSQSQHAPLLGAVTQSSPTRSATTTNAPFAASPAVQTSTFAGTDAAHGGSPPAVAAPSQAAPVERRGVDAPTTSRPAAPSRDAVISEIKQHLGARGYRVHATLSGDAQTTTLALSCATLTRELGNQVLGSRQTREALKAAGIRIVVMINGQESWTYML